jgi:hypothetical protein
LDVAKANGWFGWAKSNSDDFAGGGNVDCLINALVKFGLIQDYVVGGEGANDHIRLTLRQNRCRKCK